MTDAIRGLKAGICAGIITGILGSIIEVVLMFTILHNEFVAMSEQILAEMPSGTGINTVLMLTAISETIFALIGGIIFGIILGLIYAFLYNKIPGETAIKKGLIIGFAFFVIINVPYLLLGTDAERSALMTSAEYILGFIDSMILGSSIGWLWNNFGPKN